MADSLRIAKVVAVFPEGHAVDLVFQDTGERVPKVQVLALAASTNTGLVALPAASTPDEEYSLKNTKKRDVFAVVGYVARRPVVVGFLFPQVSQMQFKDPEFWVHRHSSDVYSTIDKNGAFEMAWPNGTYLRVGETTAHVDLTGTDFDGDWKIDPAKMKAVNVHLEVRDAAGALKTTLNIAPNGNVTFTTTGSITSSASVWNHTGTINVTSGDVTADGKSLKTHTHGGVQTGGGNTGAPN